MTRDYHIDPTYSMFARALLPLPVNVGASVAAAEQAAVLMAYAGRIVSARFYAISLTDADDSVRLDLRRNGVSIVAATLDPTTAGTTVTFAPTSDTFADGDRLSLYVTTGAGDALVGSLTLEVRPLLGPLELATPIQQS